MEIAVPNFEDNPEISRRRLLEATAAGAAALTVPLKAMAMVSKSEPQTAASVKAPVTSLRLRANGHDYALAIDPRTTLLDALREHLGLTGSKKGCDHGQCGACTVLVDGRRINSCLTLTVMHEGDAITTIEGLADGDRLHPMQAAFIARDGFQCGYCTPGQICSSIAMLEEAARGMPSYLTADLTSERAALTDDEIRERMSGNICRCAAYPNIISAIRDVADGVSPSPTSARRTPAPPPRL